MKYRPDIDGLRALAVIPVILFHANRAWCPGGFIGVDIFFVISGFLITTIIQKEIIDGTFSILGFYERRIKRILPALFTVMTASIIAGWFILFPNDYRELGQSTFAASLSLANVHFWRESAYFENSSELKPLLHTWSLSIEEQFYLFFPLLLLLLHKRARKYTFGIIVVLSVMSLGLCIYATCLKPSATFYLLPTRAWELALGALLALWIIHKEDTDTPRSTKSIKAFGIIGLLLISAPLVLYTKGTPFPGYTALAPCLGTAIIIATQTSHVSRALSWKPLVFIGKISYSLYLWHWPIFVFMRHYMIETPSNIHMVIASIATIPIAVLSWRFIEQPFRGKGAIGSLPRWKMITAGGVSIAAFTIMGSILHVYRGIESRFPEHVVKLSQKDKYPFGEVNLFAEPPVGGADVTPRYALWGDSNAMAISASLAQLASENNQSCKIYTRSVHPPVIGLEYKWRKQHIASEKVLNDLLQDENIKFVIMHSSWGYCFRNEESRRKIHHEKETKGSDLLQETINILISHNKTVVLVYPVPTHHYDPLKRISKMATRGLKTKGLSDAYVYNDEKKVSLEALDMIPHHPKIIRIYPSDLLMKNGKKLITTKDGVLLYRDSGHLSENGAKYLMPLFEKIFRGI